MYKSSKKENGFTIVELLVGLSIGIIVLTGLMSFFFRTSKMIGQEQTQAKNLSQFQFVMNKIIQDIKEVNTEAPGTGTTITGVQWNNLPWLPYCRTKVGEVQQPPETTYPKEFPTYPVAYNFPAQALHSGTGAPDSWYPKLDKQNPESNELAFYKVENGEITRVLYYTEADPAYPKTLKALRIRRKQQFNIIPTSNTYYDSTLRTKDDIILSGVKYVQFTYPLLNKKLDSDSPDFDPDLKTQLINITDSEPKKIPYLQSQILNPYRNIINIRIVTAGPQIGNALATALELSTEVTIRN